MKKSALFIISPVRIPLFLTVPLRILEDVLEDNQKLWINEAKLLIIYKIL